MAEAGVNYASRGGVPPGGNSGNHRHRNLKPAVAAAEPGVYNSTAEVAVPVDDAPMKNLHVA